MAQELYYTSAPAGLRPNTRGFCTVAASSALRCAGGLAERVEALSTYRHHFTNQAGGAASGSAGEQGGAGGENPVAWAHWLLSLGGKEHHVLSRIADAGLDYTQRTNAFAHHLVLDNSELPPGGPAWLARQPGVMATTWNKQVEELAPNAVLARLRTAGGLGGVGASGGAGVCLQWQRWLGDAGWAGFLIDAFIKQPTRPAFLIFGAGQGGGAGGIGDQLLGLLGEAIALLPPAQRWQVTFNTYFTSLPPGTTCLWRCCLAGSPAAASVQHGMGGGGALVLDLTDPQRLPPLVNSSWVTYARSGQKPVESGKWQANTAARSAASAPIPPVSSAAAPIGPQITPPAANGGSKPGTGGEGPTVGAAPSGSLAGVPAWGGAQLSNPTKDETPAGPGAPIGTAASGAPWEGAVSEPSVAPRRALTPGLLLGTEPAKEYSQASAQLAGTGGNKILLWVGLVVLGLAVLGLIVWMSGGTRPPRDQEERGSNPNGSLPLTTSELGNQNGVGGQAGTKSWTKPLPPLETGNSSPSTTAPAVEAPVVIVPPSKVVIPTPPPEVVVPPAAVGKLPLETTLPGSLTNPMRSSAVTTQNKVQRLKLDLSGEQVALLVRARAVHLEFPGPVSGVNGSASHLSLRYKESGGAAGGVDGIFTQESEVHDGMVGLMVSWKSTQDTGGARELVSIHLDPQSGAVELSWRAAALGSPERARVAQAAYWILLQCTLAAEFDRGGGGGTAGAGGTTMQIHLPRPEIQQLALGVAREKIFLPANLPPGTGARIPVLHLPHWRADLVEELPEKNGVKDKRGVGADASGPRHVFYLARAVLGETATPPAVNAAVQPAWFTMSLTPDYDEVELSFARNLQTVKIKIQECRNGLQTLQADMKRARDDARDESRDAAEKKKQEIEAKLQTDLANMQVQEKRIKDELAAQQQLAQDYQEIKALDLVLELPGGIPAVTLHFGNDRREHK